MGACCVTENSGQIKKNTYKKPYGKPVMIGGSSG